MAFRLIDEQLLVIIGQRLLMEKTSIEDILRDMSKCQVVTVTEHSKPAEPVVEPEKIIPDGSLTPLTDDLAPLYQESKTEA